MYPTPMTKQDLAKAISNPHAFVRGQYDAIQFAYIPDYTKEELDAWGLGFRYGKTEGPFLYLEDLEDAIARIG